MENQSTYRIRTKLGETEPINIPVNLMQEYNSFEILSLNINTNESYRSYTSTEGIVVGRVSTANNGLGIPNVRVSIFVPKNSYDQSDEEKVMYPFSSPTDLDGDRVRYNLLPSDSDVSCYQVIGTMPSKRRILDNETVCDVFEKYYKYTTVTNEAGDFMLTNIPVGNQKLHIDADLSDIGPFLSQKPYNMIEGLGIDKNKFESSSQFKYSKDLNSLAQVISQDKSIYVYPYWGDATENSSEMKITRTDLSLNYEFNTNAIFIGSVITDKGENGVRHNCTPPEKAGKMSEMITGPGRIEMIRKTVDNKVEQFRIKGDELIDSNGVWCYSIPMNLDYVRTDEFGNIIPTDDPNKGVPTRARVRFRVTLNEMQSDSDAHKRASFLIPNNPHTDDEKFLKENTADYSFGTETWDESFVDLFWNKVYTVKSFIPRMQKSTHTTNRKHSGIKMVNHYGDNNPFPYNNLSIKLNFLYRLICTIVKIFIGLIRVLNVAISTIGGLPCLLLKIPLIKKIKGIKKVVPSCIPLSSEFCDDGINRNVYYPGCYGCVWKEKTKPDCLNEEYQKSQMGDLPADCINSRDDKNEEEEVMTCVENQLAQDNEATSFNFSNDWINGCLYMPLWYRHIKPKKSYFFGLIKKNAKDQYCAGENNVSGRSLKLLSSCANNNQKLVKGTNYRGKDVYYNIASDKNACTTKCHEKIEWVNLSNGFIIKRETMLGQTAWYYKSAEIVPSNTVDVANEYLNYNGDPMVSKTLYATDIVMIGSLNDCDSNGIPKFFNSLKGTTYNMPTDILFSDTEIEYSVDDNGNVVDQDVTKMSVASGCDWGNPNEYGYNDGGLFYSIGCSKIQVDDSSCMNLRRLCELGVGMDEVQYIDNLKVSIESDHDSLNYNENEYYLRPDGFVSYDDIIDSDYRSMFATLNSNRLKTKVNSENGVREYDFRHLYVDNFDGSLHDIMRNEQQKRPNANYRFNYNLEQTNLDYLTFRMGDNPFFYDGKSLVKTESNEGPKRYSLPKYQNSFYFYFGLKDGKTAIDLFNEQYNAPCAPRVSDDIKETIPYEKSPNSWCCLDEDLVSQETNEATYDHSTHNGYLKLNLDDLPLPCTAIFNLKNDSSVTYTVVDEDNNVSINHDRICFYGENSATSGDTKLTKGYHKYYLRYENITKELPESANKCQMLNNGEYELTITDAEGNYHSFIIDLSGEVINYGTSLKNFGMGNEDLISYYGNYDNVAKSPQIGQDGTTDKIFIEANEIPNVNRHDYDKSLVVKEDKPEFLKLNGTICIYNPVCGSTPVDDLLIEIEPYDKMKDEDGVEYYSDEDFWLQGDKTKTWYQKKMFTHHDQDQSKSIICNDATVFKDDEGIEYVYSNGLSQYFYYTTIKMNNIDVRCYIIKCPKGDTNYRVRVTQLCAKTNADGKIDYYKTQNFSEQKNMVGQPTPYRLYINDINYDIIKNFDTGWKIRPNQQNAQSMVHTGPSPFDKNNPASLCAIPGHTGVVGWLELGDVNKNYNWSAEEKQYGKNSMRFGKNGNSYKLKEAIEIKENNEPQEPIREKYLQEEDYNAEYEKWVEAHEQWENGAKNKDGKRMEGFDKWDADLPKEEEHIIVNGYDIVCVCGYKYMVEANEILDNRLEFVSKMKNAFWIQDASNGHTISYSVQTDELPYDVWTMYAPEMTSNVNDEYNETESKEKSDKRVEWFYSGESTTYISDIKVPTITNYKSADFGCVNGTVVDTVRKNKKPSFGELWDSGQYSYKYTDMCYAQDNIAKDSENGSISIKPPYMVACVNAEGMTKPTNLPKGKFFGDEVNTYGITKNSFGPVPNNKQYLSDGTNQFFMFHLVDKIFKPDIVCWSHISNIPNFLTSAKYGDVTYNDAEPGKGGVAANAKVGGFVNAQGLLAGNILNGISNSQTDTPSDFSEMKAFEKDLKIISYNEEESIPTRRYIVQNLIADTEDDKYVDLGLTSGTLWAKTNIGADSEEKCGLYFQWGDTQSHSYDEASRLGWKECPFNNGQEKCDWNYFGGIVNDITLIREYYDGSKDIKLKTEYDYAYINSKGEESIPTVQQYRELWNGTDKEWCKYNGVYGMKFVSKEDKTKFIFIPSHEDGQQKIKMLTKSLSTDYSKAYGILIDSNTPQEVIPNVQDSYKCVVYMERCFATPIRSVYAQNNNTQTYSNYRHIDVKNGQQYVLVPRTIGELTVTDAMGNTISEELYGGMRVLLSSADLGGYSWTQQFLNFRCMGTSGETDITYVMFKVNDSETGKKSQHDKNRTAGYPLNRFTTNDEEQNILNVGLNQNESSSGWAFNYERNNSQKIFGANVTLNDLLKHCTYEFCSTNIKGDLEPVMSVGYGNNGKFECSKAYRDQTGRRAFFIVAQTKNNCRAISPVYDLTQIYCVIEAMTNYADENVLRIGFTNIINGTSFPDIYMPYEFHQYYLANYDFTVECNIYAISGQKTIDNDIANFDEAPIYTFSFDYEVGKKRITYVTKEEFETSGVGSSYYDFNGNTYTVYTKISPTVTVEAESEYRSGGEWLSDGTYYFGKNDKWKKIVVYSGYDRGSVTVTDQKETPTTNILESGRYYTHYEKEFYDSEGGTYTKTYFIPFECIDTHVVSDIPMNPSQIPFFNEYYDEVIRDENIFNNIKNVLHTYEGTSVIYTTNLRYYVQIVVKDIIGTERYATVANVKQISGYWDDFLYRQQWMQ